MWRWFAAAAGVLLARVFIRKLREPDRCKSCWRRKGRIVQVDTEERSGVRWTIESRRCAHCGFNYDTKRK